MSKAALCLITLLLAGMAYAVAEYEFLTPNVAVLISRGKNVTARAEAGEVVAAGTWTRELGLLRDRKGNILRQPDIAVYSYWIFREPFKVGEKRLCSGVELHYQPENPSKVFKLNQVGNGARQPRKYAYMGAWLGSGGPLPLKHLAGKMFELRRSEDGGCVFSNVMRLRREDPLYRGTVPFTGEEVLELDYSEYNIPGKYYFYVDGIGRSMDFVIGPEAVNEAFYIHARGLYHKRCGIAKSRPYTHWESPACHLRAIPGTFPGNDGHYRLGRGEKSAGFFDRKDNRLEVKHFELIAAQNLREPEPVAAAGGWHDAADYDRRPYHLRIVCDLAAVYLMKPENFIDGQLNIPESGNGIPDILDEAAWGVRHLLAVQREDGGVGTWFETTGHPGPGEGMPDQDRRTYYIAGPGRNGTLEFAAAASALALALKKAGAVVAGEKYLSASIKAWDFALLPGNRHVAWFGMKGKILSYREEPYLNGENLLRAGVNLFKLTGDGRFLEAVSADLPRIREEFNRDFWRWSPLAWMCLELEPVAELATLRAEYRKVILRKADEMLDNQEGAYPVRMPWHGAEDGKVHNMAWGNYHPLRCAMTLIAAHRMTGEEKYLTGAYLANDFHNGANPLGRSMTSGLGKIYPAAFLDLVSYADGSGEFVPGITPFGNTFGIDRNAVKMVYREQAELLPIFRRYVNLEFLSVPSSEYSVWETIAPAVVVSGYLVEKPALPPENLKNRKPAEDFRKVPGYLALP